MTDHGKLREITPVEVKHIPFKDEMLPGHAYVSEEYGTLAMLCPCGCGEEIAIAINRELWSGATDHFWSHALKDGKLTISPSILQRTPCRSHFFVRDNRIDWC